MNKLDFFDITKCFYTCVIHFYGGFCCFLLNIALEGTLKNKVLLFFIWQWECLIGTNQIKVKNVEKLLFSLYLSRLIAQMQENVLQLITQKKIKSN
jgi:hypothetical protein